MASLHLPPAPSSSGRAEDSGAVEKRWRSLCRLEEIIAKVSSGGEARMWLCSALGDLELPSSAQKAAFLGLVSTKNDVCERVVRMICENRPSWAARVIARDDRLLRRFFDGDSKRILQWFGKFSTGGNTEHQWGARALAKYTFVHRDSCWHELDWKGKHGQAPATVASKPHYFLELDVLRTMDNFLDNVPSFWKSDELYESLKDGDFISLDIDFFVRELVDKILVDDSPDAWNLVEEYLAEETLSKLSNCLLHLLSEQNLLGFINELVMQVSKANPAAKGPRWLQELISSGEECKKLSDLLICNACVNHRKQILNIMRDEDFENEAQSLTSLVSELNTHDSDVVWRVRREFLKLDKWNCMKWFGIETWSLYTYLTAKKDEILYPVLFEENGFKFEAHEFTQRKRKRNSKKKSKRRRHEESDTSEDDSSEDICWKLSTDNFQFLWRKEDLPEHLSGYVFENCVKWIVSGW